MEGIRSDSSSTCTGCRRMPPRVPSQSCPPSFTLRVSSTSPRGEPNTSCVFNPSSCAGAGIGSRFVWMRRSPFPWRSGDTRAVLSFFGDSRDGGRRGHRGVDIFAPRGTPVLSATDGRVYRVETTLIGGNVVWVRASDQVNRVYYAHLDSQVVRTGMEVKRGTLLGFVGNTGNARTTPPPSPLRRLSSPGGRRRSLLLPLSPVADTAGCLRPAGLPRGLDPNGQRRHSSQRRPQYPRPGRRRARGIHAPACSGRLGVLVPRPASRWSGRVRRRSPDGGGHSAAPKPVYRERVRLVQFSEPCRASDGRRGGRHGGRRTGELRRVPLRAVPGRKHGLASWSGRPLRSGTPDIDHVQRSDPFRSIHGPVRAPPVFLAEAPYPDAVSDPIL